MTIVTRPTLAALVAAAALLASAPATALAGDGDAKPLSDEQAYQLTCGHLGVPCGGPHKRHHRSHSARAKHR